MMIGSVTTPPPGPSSRASGAGCSLHRTLDLEHSSALKRLGRERKRASELRLEASTMQGHIARLECKGRSLMTDADFDELKRCRNVRHHAEVDAEDADRLGDEIGYYMRTAGTLFKYYDVVEKGGGGGGGQSAAANASVGAAAPAQQPQPQPRGQEAAAAGPPKKPRGGSILSYFSSSQQTVAAPATSAAAAALSTTTAAGQQTQDQDQPQQQGDDRATLFDRYLQSVDCEGPVRYNAPDPHHHHAPSAGGGRRGAAAAAEANAQATPAGACGHCGGRDRTMQLQDGYVFCNACHTIEYVLVDHEKPSYKDPPKEAVYFAYKRINHFNEWLNQVQGKETTEIPEEVYDSILFEIKKQKLTNMAMLTRVKVKNILKKLRINKYYEHVPHIINRINGIPSPHFSQELEDRLRHMFCMIQVPFLKHAPVHRKNFLSYSFCLNKMVQLLEKDEYLESFPLLKSREKLHQQDLIWQKICAEIGWDFIPSL